MQTRLFENTKKPSKTEQTYTIDLSMQKTLAAMFFFSIKIGEVILAAKVLAPNFFW